MKLKTNTYRLSVLPAIFQNWPLPVVVPMLYQRKSRYNFVS